MDENVDPLAGRRDERPRLLGVDEIRGDGEDFGAEVLAGAGGLLRGGGVGAVAEDEAGPGSGERERDRATEAAGPAGDDGDAAAKVGEERAHAETSLAAGPSAAKAAVTSRRV